MIEVLNKKNEKIISRNNPNELTVSFSKTGRIYFSTAATERFNLRVGLYVHFAVLTDKTWVFYVNKDESGYKLFTLSKSPGVSIESKNICRELSERVGHELPAKFYIKPTQSTHDGNVLTEILTHKPINKIGRS